jgi:heavy metal translocating P-type ATPase
MTPPVVRQSAERPKRREIWFAVVLVGAMSLRALTPDAPWSAALVALVALGVFWPTMREGMRGLARRQINIELYNSLAVAVTLALGEWLSAAFIALMLVAARYLDELTAARSRRSLAALMAMRPRRVTVERDGALAEIAPEDLTLGETVVVREGETVPVDGEVVFGGALVSEASVTGEARPVLKVVGGEVVSSSLVASGLLKVRPTRLGADGTLERIIRLVEEAQASQTRTLRLADRFAAFFAPTVAALALGAYLAVGRAEAAVAVLLVACADDVAVSIPLAYLATVGAAASRGLLVNGAAALEKLGRVTTVFFDKTGTLTFGEPRVTEFKAALPGDERFWRLVGAVERYSRHPLAEAVRREVAARGILPPEAVGFESVAGCGVRAEVEGSVTLGGARAWLVQCGVAGLAADGADDVWHFAHGGTYLGYVAVRDALRPEAAEAIGRLRRQGVRRFAMLTGDADEAAAAAAAALGIGEVRSRLKPEDKLALIREARANGEVVAMVGDGVNDAPALAAADVGVAMGRAGTAVAIETAQVVILGDDLRLLSEAVRLSRSTRRVVAGDFAIWFVTNALGLGLVFAGFMGPALAAAYNFGTDFLPMLNSARLFALRRRPNSDDAR